jgi:FAD/FMN-containing dehydrogenase
MTASAARMELSSSESVRKTESAAHPFVERTDIVSWGRVVRETQRVARPQFRDELPRLLSDPSWDSKLAVGLRRSYGDSCLNGQGALIDATGLDRVVAFDPKTGRLKAEAGMSLSEALKLIVPHGWFLPTTPGTRFVTLGGSVSNDVHGKNHHRAGTFGANVIALGLLRSDGRRIAMAPDLEPELFSATIGGLGLTGMIEWVELRLAPIPSAWLEVEIVPFDGLDAFWPLAEESVGAYEHTVAWVDCTLRAGRGVLRRANWAPGGGLDTHDDGAFKTVPADLPGFALNPLFVASFNELYYTLHRVKSKRARQHYSKYFYPLDAVLNWNRLYGSRGMLQHQCVISFATAREAMRLLLEEIARSGQASFLAVLKTFGDRPSPGLLSFPRPGATLALDFPNRGVETLALMSRLDAIVSEAGGALYPAKDGRMTAAMFRSSYPNWERLGRLKDQAMNSDFWRRVAE